MCRAVLVLALLLTTACGGGEEEPRTPSAEPPREIEVDASSTLYGFVGDTAGNPVEGVVVSDGFQCVATDAGGVYEMKRNAAAEYVYYSVPAEFKIRTGHDGYPDFYVRLDTSQQKIRQDFTLERLAGVHLRGRPDVAPLGVENHRHQRRLLPDVVDRHLQLGLRALTAPGLPGKWAPLTAAQAIRDAVYNILEV